MRIKDFNFSLEENLIELKEIKHMDSYNFEEYLSVLYYKLVKKKTNVMKKRMNKINVNPHLWFYKSFKSFTCVHVLNPLLCYK
jgi:hypothetical protein